MLLQSVYFSAAVAGLAHHPLQQVWSGEITTKSLVTGVGLGLVGVVTKPLSGAAELVALTGQGLLQGAGWNSLPSVDNYYRLFISNIEILRLVGNKFITYSLDNDQWFNTPPEIIMQRLDMLGGCYLYLKTIMGIFCMLLMQIM